MQACRDSCSCLCSCLVTGDSYRTHFPTDPTWRIPAVRLVCLEPRDLVSTHTHTLLESRFHLRHEEKNKLIESTV
ncbi:UNVERIFIED_CONTAM: hypothetical protein FKN15_033751 [Acipenser sinensis]